jgi:hypothetical protein
MVVDRVDDKRAYETQVLVPLEQWQVFQAMEEEVASALVVLMQEVQGGSPVMLALSVEVVH